MLGTHGKVFNAAVYLLKVIYPMTQPSLTQPLSNKQKRTYLPRLVGTLY